MTSTVAMLEREVSRCRHCHLNQFLTGDGRCRRCGLSLAPEAEPEPEPEIVPQATVAVRNWRRGLPWGVLLFELRTAAGLSQSAMSKRMRSPRTFLSKLERRQTPPHYKTVSRLAGALGLPAYVLIDDAGMAHQLCVQALLKDEFLAEIYEAVRGQEAEYLQLMCDAVIDLMQNRQYTIPDWSFVGPKRVRGQDSEAQE